MATGITLAATSNLTSGQKILVAAAKTAFEAAAPNPDLVAGERIPVGHKQYDVSTYARLSDASALTEGVDLAQSEQLVTAVLSITPSEHGVIATLSKRLIRRQGDSNVVGEAGRMIANSLRRRMDKDIIALYDTYTKSVGGASVDLDLTYFRGSAAYLRTDNSSAYGPAPMPLNAALHPEHISAIVLDITDPGTQAGTRFGEGWPVEMLQQWWRGRDRAYGIAIFDAGNIAKDAASDAKGGLFSKESLYLVMANEADATEEPDNSLRAKEYGIFQEWGEGLRADPHGVEMYFDATATV